MSESLNRCRLEVDLAAIVGNYRVLRDYCGKEVVGVVKADAYGHGAVPVARALEDAGCRFFAVAALGEALELRAAGIGGEVLIFGFTPPECAVELAAHKFTQTLVSLEYARELNAAAVAPIKCHVKIDVGMSRLGETNWDFAALRELRNLKVEGVFTHFPVSDQSDSASITVTESQLREFVSAVAELRTVCGLYDIKIHCANSGAVLEHPSAYHTPFNMVRPGIALYGQYIGTNSAELNLKPAQSWFAGVCQVKEVPPGTSVSYGGTWSANSTRRIAVISAGYADGYSRALSNRGKVFINGAIAPVVGRVCMDFITADVTDIPGVKAGDNAELLGSHILCSDVSELLGTITYEVLCGISKRVVRLYK
ncbi:MAG: alanine racemase [Oscillospiraceae bacterium]|nr:alanine racemase [Oscillospiraceae bacterium]